MADVIEQPTDTLYEADEHAWIERQIAALRDGALDRLDRANLIAYLTDMAARDRRELGSRLIVLYALFAGASAAAYSEMAEAHVEDADPYHPGYEPAGVFAAPAEAQAESYEPAVHQAFIPPEPSYMEVATPEAEGMLMEKHFRLMKKTAIFINTGRGPTVQEAGLIKALEEGWIAHAGLDVLEIEPPGNNNPILQMQNVTLSAHTASASARFDPARKRHVGRELALVLNGKWPMSCVNPAVLMNSKLRRWQPVSMERGPNS